MQRQRFEQKYILSEAQAQTIRGVVAAHLEVDENGIGRPDFSYPVHSLYLDSPQLTTFWSTINGNKNRYKLRLRFYDDDPNSPVYLEIKQRVNNCILKQRAAATKSGVTRLLQGYLPEPGDLSRRDPKTLLAVHRFLELLEQLDASPQAYVTYVREAYSHPVTESVRVTFDRAVQIEIRREAIFTTTMTRPSRPFGNRVIMELKFTDRCPDWCRQVVQDFQLTQSGAAKYCEGVAGLPEFGVAHTGDFREPSQLARMKRDLHSTSLR